MDFNPNEEVLEIFEEQLPDGKKIYFKELSGSEYIDLMKLSDNDAELLRSFIEMSWCDCKGIVYKDVLKKLKGKRFAEIAELATKVLTVQLPQKKS